MPESFSFGGAHNMRESINNKGSMHVICRIVVCEILETLENHAIHSYASPFQRHYIEMPSPRPTILF